MNIYKKTISFVTLLLLFSTTIKAQSVDLVASVDQMPPFTNGQTFNYSILSTGNPYNALRVKLEYNPSVLQLNSLTPVYAFDFTPVNDTGTPGLVKYEAASLSGNITTDEIIFTIEFEVLDSNQTISIAHNYDMADGTVVVNSGGNNILGTANDILLETLGVNGLETQNLSVFPNPANSELNIQSLGNVTIRQISIYTLDGKTVLNKQVSDFLNSDQSLVIDVSGLKEALYFMDVYGDNGYKKSYKVLISH